MMRMRLATRKSYSALAIFTILVIVVTNVWAAPEVRPLNQATVFITASDDILVRCFSAIIIGGVPLNEYVVTSPDGRTITFTETPTEAPCSTLSGGQTPVCNIGAGGGLYGFSGNEKSQGGFAVVGDLTGAPVDGTWTVEMRGPTVAATSIEFCMSVGGKLFLLVSATGPTKCLYNWHQAPTSYFGSSQSGGCQIFNDATTDPNNYRFFRAANSDPAAFTNGFMTQCDPVGTMDTISINGDWTRGADQVTNTFVRFAFGSPIGNTAQSTTLVDDGAGASGTHSENVPYSDSGGTSYVFRARAGPTGPEQSGATVGVSPGLCTSESTDDNPKAFTNGFMVVCPASLTVNGNWQRGATQVGNTFVRFQIDGSFTTLVDDGSGASGDHSAVTAYNNAVGHTYSFKARAGASGTEQSGATVTVLAGLCTNQNPDTSPHPFTTQSIVTCPATASINGVWARGTAQTSNTFVRFAHIQGLVTGDNDLRNNGATLTALVDDGAGSMGDHQVTIFYNNIAGNSYQLLARSGAAGNEVLGSVLIIPPGQCQSVQPPSQAGADHDENEFDLTASQAQCAGDQVQFSIDVSDGSSGDVVSLLIIDGDTGLVPMTVSEGQMFSISFQVFHVNLVLVSGPWVALAQIDYTGVLTPSRFDSAAFNVPVETCAGTETDLTPVLDAIDAHDTEMGNQHDAQDLFHGGGGGGGSDLQFLGLSVVQSWSLILFLAFFLWSMWNGWLFTTGASFLTLPIVFVNNYPMDFPGGFFLIIIGLMLQWVFQGFRATRDTGPDIGGS